MSTLGPIPISARSFDEYVEMFRLTEADLASSILDAAAGGASFVAEVGARCGRATAVDPAYLEPASRLCRHVILEAERGCADAEASDGLARKAAARRFAVHYVERPDRYVAGALPALPFADGAFDLVLCSHFLFTYADRLSEAFHARSLRELCRVSRGEVRVFPLVDVTGAPYARLDALRSLLASECIDSAVEATAVHQLLRLAGPDARFP